MQKVENNNGTAVSAGNEKVDPAANVNVAEKKTDYRKQKKLEKKRKRKEKKGVNGPADSRLTSADVKAMLAAPADSLVDKVQIEYVENDDQILSGRDVNEFKHIFDYFKLPQKKEEPAEAQKEEQKPKKEPEAPKLGFIQANYESLPADLNVDTSKLSKKKLKQLKRMKVSELKQMVKRPDMVEVWDVTSNDPLFLIWMKSYRNAVPVPKHWAQKKKYLQYKRGIPKPPFQLPDFIEATGITRLRNVIGHDPGRNVRQKMRDRMNPKLGKMEIDYQILHDAFFRYQKKPCLTIHGDLYYEGKEYELKMRKFKPGKVSPELRGALGIADTAPPPWLINMQRYGPPPSYPNLKIPGVNVPIPETISWGKLFTDDKGYTVYADCQGLIKLPSERAPILPSHWGDLKPEEEEEEERAEEKPESEPEPEEEAKGAASAARAVDFRTGIASVVSGLETPDVDIRKPAAISRAAADSAKEEAKAPAQTAPGELYQVLERVERQGSAQQLLDPGYGYKIPDDKSRAQPTGKEAKKPEEPAKPAKKPGFTF